MAVRTARIKTYNRICLNCFSREKRLIELIPIYPVDVTSKMRSFLRIIVKGVERQYHIFECPRCGFTTLWRVN